MCNNNECVFPMCIVKKLQISYSFTDTISAFSKSLAFPSNFIDVISRAFHRFSPPSSRHFRLYICSHGLHWHSTSKLISATSSLSHGFHRTHSNLLGGGGALRLELPLPTRLRRPRWLVAEHRRRAGPSCPSRFGAPGGHHEPLLPRAHSEAADGSPLGSRLPPDLGRLLHQSA